MTVADPQTDLQFADNRLLPILTGDHDRHLARLEHQLGVSIRARGNTLSISGDSDARALTEDVLKALWARLEAGLPVGPQEVDAAVRIIDTADAAAQSVALEQFTRRDGTQRRRRMRHSVTPRSVNQARYLTLMDDFEMVFAVGPAGTGKTFLAVAKAVALMEDGVVDRIVLTRPAVEAGERLGFLPGDMREKVDPYLRPLYDALHYLLPGDTVERRLANGEIEIAPLAYMRGRTLAHAFVILDEAQNTTPMQMRMFLTRLGEGGRMVITGDPSQVDLPAGTRSGLTDALSILRTTDGIGVLSFGDQDVVRHKLVARIVKAYDRADKLKSSGAPPGLATGEAEISAAKTPDA